MFVLDFEDGEFRLSWEPTEPNLEEALEALEAEEVDVTLITARG